MSQRKTRKKHFYRDKLSQRRHAGYAFPKERNGNKELTMEKKKFQTSLNAKTVNRGKRLSILNSKNGEQTQYKKRINPRSLNLL